MPKIFQFKIQLQNINKPPIWRKVEVNANDTFYDLHNIIQGTMGWYNAHLHQFLVGYRSIGIPSPHDFMDTEDGRKIKLSQFFKNPKDRIMYEYDFGDGWQHIVTLEATVKPEPGVTYPRLTKGKSACPPEDCGGPWAYVELRENLNNPKHPDYADLRDWMGMEEDEDFDPKAFDLEERQKKTLKQYEFGKKSQGKEYLF